MIDDDRKDGDVRADDVYKNTLRIKNKAIIFIKITFLRERSTFKLQLYRLHISLLALVRNAKQTQTHKRT